MSNKPMKVLSEVKRMFCEEARIEKFGIQAIHKEHVEHNLDIARPAQNREHALLQNSFHTACMKNRKTILEYLSRVRLLFVALKLMYFDIRDKDIAMVASNVSSPVYESLIVPPDANDIDCNSFTSAFADFLFMKAE